MVADLLGSKEAAQVLGGKWTTNLVSANLSMGRFPKPLVRLACGPVWTRRTIEALRDELAARETGKTKEGDRKDDDRN